MPPKNRGASTASNAASQKATKTRAPAKTKRSSATTNTAPTSNGRSEVKQPIHDEIDDGEENESDEGDESFEEDKIVEKKEEDEPTRKRKQLKEVNGGRMLDKMPAQAPPAPRRGRAAGKVTAASVLVDEGNDSRDDDRRGTKTAARASKRKREVEDKDEDKPEEESDEPEEAPKAKKPRSVPAASKKPEKPKAKAKAKAPKPAPEPAKAAETIVSTATQSRPQRAAPRTRGPGARGLPFNEVPTKELDVFVFGEGSSGELGLGSTKHDGKKPIDVKRPRLNHNLKNIVALACGGMHCVALTQDQKILTWGVNDDKALGRNTFWEGGTRDVDDESDDEDDDDTGINPNESTPGEVDISMLPEGTRIAQVAACDSASFILTDDGWVYGWGTFRGADGIIGFSEHARIQETPVLIPGLKNITKLACGANHVLALDLSGKVFTWGSGGQFQLGRKPVSRLSGPSAGLNPQPCGKFTKRHHAVDVSAGSYHSFYVDNEDQIWAWGLNNYSQTGLREHTGEDEAMILHPKLVESLQDHKVTQIEGGLHHSVACTSEGKLLTWGRVDGHQIGQPSNVYNDDNTIFDDEKKPRILLQPTAIDGINATFIATGSDTSFVINNEGKVYSWGFSANYQTGQGSTDDVEVPTLIDNSAIRDRRIVWAGAGGQYSVVAAGKDDEVPNGH
ncbi:RCC1/BLIP-II [Daldinia caldariorum]|uniref:RCC1/BLIP-II n=1 Tax=Daldinia caldariorum TaxID=326644 RepID=UPI002007598C|nr:RCC1/BLIP-II [Daldinia caldariorum]KAI1472215.1 RCC1/BLIP-II [Daldinia caldariorum]